jgi:hypothetical protein
MASYDGQLINYSNAIEVIAPVNLAAAKDTFGYTELAAVIIIRVATDFLDPATQYNLAIVWSPTLATRLESTVPVTPAPKVPVERWS